MNVTSASPAVDPGPVGETEAGVVARPLSRLSDADLGTLLMIRHFERAVLELFSQGRLHGTTHTCLGQEYIPVALYPLLDEGDYVFSNHRGHGHYLARFHDPHGLLAEIMGRAGAVCHGVGGSQHIYRDRYLSTGVQGQSLPVAVGVGLHLKQAEPGRIAVVHIGDGTWGEGAVYEALNMAQLWQVPVLVVVEHNGIAQSTPTERQMSGTVAARAAAFGVGHLRIDSVDVTDVRAALTPAVEQVRDRHRPYVVECVTHRVGPHSKGDDTRAAEVRERAARHDWYRRYRHDHPAQFAAADQAQAQAVAAVVREVGARPASRWEAR
ncbi:MULTISPECIES: thiamine pyrophosphate-dependent dehydrogenase E1 component subunit alpha [Streptomyces]|uniref:thiamine pyrophosphate-dependent dehydrogenase E1 component subunit alpha n=1 Tax=Streptomyces TaxID=1883 RepID=UPI000FD76F5A|nr:MULTISPECIES: thiamine pyrophosphate-dependent dehydrogenase E1 component subunit alpha [unclassified Streptomyces]MCW1092700.1 thiamine pyrophosphate-dependent dehydrogenase E1 component subunit alpha [Streptomyces sp. RS2]